MQNNAPDFIRGTYVWRIVIADEPNALDPARKSIETVANLLGGKVRQVVFVNGCMGVDDNYPNWDGPWPYLGRPSFRINHDWNYLSEFMTDMRERHNCWISFHVNLTDVNVGLGHDPVHFDFFERMRAASCMYTRDGGSCGQPYTGMAYVPQSIPADVAKMPYMKAGDAGDIFAIVDYKKFWESGLAKESIGALYDYLPYPPLILYTDVMTLTGGNLTVGYPDGLLGGSAQSQSEGRQIILDYLRSLGSEPGGEGPVDYSRYGWSHGGLASNDYQFINTGFGHGCAGARGGKGMQVYGNQGGYHHQLDWMTALAEPASHGSQKQLRGPGDQIMVVQDMTGDNERRLPFPLRGNEVDGVYEIGTAQDMARNFYLTVIQELYHIGKGNVRLPGGSAPVLLDAAEGRAEIDCVYLLPPGAPIPIETKDVTGAKLLGTASLRDEKFASGGKIATGIGEALFNGVTFDLVAPKAGSYNLIIRYLSPEGGRLTIELNGNPAGAVDLPATEPHSSRFGDYCLAIELRAGKNEVSLTKGEIYAEWSDGTRARWDRDGFRAWNGDVIFGAGFDRMWPDTWSGDMRIHFYSRDGANRVWRLPEEWTSVGSATLYPLTPRGQGEPIELTVTGRCVAPELSADVPYILIPGTPKL